MTKGVLFFVVLFLSSVYCAETYTTQVVEFDTIKYEKNTKLLIYTKKGGKVYLDKYEYVNDRFIGIDGSGRPREIHKNEIKKVAPLQNLCKIFYYSCKSFGDRSIYL